MTILLSRRLLTNPTRWGRFKKNARGPTYNVFSLIVSISLCFSGPNERSRCSPQSFLPAATELGGALVMAMLRSCYVVRHRPRGANGGGLASRITRQPDLHGGLRTKDGDGSRPAITPKLVCRGGAIRHTVIVKEQDVKKATSRRHRDNDLRREETALPTAKGEADCGGEGSQGNPGAHESRNPRRQRRTVSLARLEGREGHDRSCRSSKPTSRWRDRGEDEGAGPRPERRSRQGVRQRSDVRPARSI